LKLQQSQGRKDKRFTPMNTGALKSHFLGTVTAAKTKIVRVGFVCLIRGRERVLVASIFLALAKKFSLITSMAILIVLWLPVVSITPFKCHLGSCRAMPRSQVF